MRAVLDSSVAIKWVLPEADTPKAVRLRNEFREGLHDLIAPDVFPIEVAHESRATRRHPGSRLDQTTNQRSELPAAPLPLSAAPG